MRSPRGLFLLLLFWGPAGAHAQACQDWHRGPLVIDESLPYVFAFAQLGSRVVAGGDFDHATPSGQTAHNIVTWDGLTLAPLGLGTNGHVEALVSYARTSIPFSRYLVAGGLFLNAGGMIVNHIARWTEVETGFPPPQWAPMGQGFNGRVWALERFNGTTVAAGEFTQSGLASFNRIARWNDTSPGWQNLGAGANGTVRALKAFQVNVTAYQLIIGGDFTAVDGIARNRIARWTEGDFQGTWSGMGEGFNGPVYAIERHSGSIYAAGDFTMSGSTPVQRVARWTGSAWVAVGSGFQSDVQALRSAGETLYAGGTWTTPATGSGISRWNGTDWVSVAGHGIQGAVYALGYHFEELQTGGMFDIVHSQSAVFSSPSWARLFVTGSPWITQPPVPQTVAYGGTAVFTVRVAPGYHWGQEFFWYKDGSIIYDGVTGTGSFMSGARDSILTVQSVSHLDEGEYEVQVLGNNNCSDRTSSSSPAMLTVVGSISDGASPESPRTTALENLGPNPTRGGTRFSIALAQESSVRVHVHDVRGRLVRLLDAGRMPTGVHRAWWDGRSADGHPVGAGQYFVSLEIGGRRIAAQPVTVLH